MILTKKFYKDQDLAEGHTRYMGAIINIIMTTSSMASTTTETQPSYQYLLVVQNEKSAVRGLEVDALLCYFLT